MDALFKCLNEIESSQKSIGNLLGFLHVLIGRKITRRSDQAVISKGMSWRDMASVLKKVRWEPAVVRELGIDPDSLPPRDRQRYWYSAISLAHVDSAKAIEAGNRFATVLNELGYDVGPPPQASAAN